MNIKPKSFETSSALEVYSHDDHTRWDVCQAGGGDLVAEIEARDNPGREIAHLFAASSDLYDALEDMVLYYAHGTQESNIEKLPPTERTIIRAAKRALKRADG